MPLTQLQKRDKEDYINYLHRVKSNPLARAVKLNDIKHNMSRTDLTDKEEFADFIEKSRKKYMVAKAFLEAD